LLVTIDGPIKESFTDDFYDSQQITRLFSAWRSVAKNPKNIRLQKKAWRIIDGIGETLQTNEKGKSSPILRRFKTGSGFNQFFVLLNGNEPKGIPVAEIGHLCNIWQIARGRLPLHATGVIHKDQLFIFTGPSGAGKSTIANLSKEIGDLILDEDQLLLSKSSKNEYNAAAWGYSLDSCNFPIRAIFKLIQDSEDKIIQVKPLKLAQILLERHSDILGNQFFNNVLKLSFKFVAELARKVPGYELHFRKSPDFWQIIDGRFPV
jgi:hypothetical protein